MRVLLVLLGLILVPAVACAAIYNRLVTLWNRFRNAYAQIDVQLKRRYDLIPNLVETTKGYLAHERNTLGAVVAARNAASAANARAAENPGEAAAMAGVVAAETTLAANLGRFLGLVENYPDLKGDRTMARLMEELASSENRVAFARQAYNDAVMYYNTALETFPNLLFARAFGFAPAHYFKIEDAAEREAVKVALP